MIRNRKAWPLAALFLAVGPFAGCDTTPTAAPTTLPAPTDKAEVPKGPATAADPKNVKPANAP